MMNYSVLMAVYHKDNPQYFDKAIESIVNQTVITDDFVLVCDGPLTDELNEVITKYCSQHVFFNIIRLDKNGGLGNALNIGIIECKNEIIARMDSDDISMPTRCEKQINLFKDNNNLAIVSSSIDEYNEEYSKKLSTKMLPETNKDIRKYYSKRSPFNHPVVMYKKEAVINSGSYQDFYLLEDYYLWIRMINRGYEGYNSKETLLHMRTGEGMIKRRGGLKYFKSNVRLQKYLLKNKNINVFSYMYHVLIRFIIQVLMPQKIRSLFYKTFLR